MALTQNYYNWIKAVKFGIGTGTYKQWTNMPNTLKVKTSDNLMLNPTISGNNSLQERYAVPFERITNFNTNSAAGVQCIIPSSNENDESVDDYTCSISFTTTNFDIIGNDVTRIVDWTNNTATIKAKYINKTSAAVTVYGLEFIYRGVFLYNQSSGKDVLFCRKKFDTPITVQPGEIIELSLSWEVA